MVVLPEILLFILIIGALADVITGNGRVKHLDKMTWVLIIIFLPLIGSILWFAVGRDYGSVTTVPAAESGRAAVPMLDTERELAALDREIEAHEKAARIADLEAKIKAKREAKGGAS